MPKLSIRPASKAGLEALARLEADAFESDRLSPRSYRRLIGAATAAVRLARSGGAVVGADVVLFKTGSRVARLYSLAVDPAHRGKGIAAALLADAERVARRRGCRALRLEVRADNAAAIRLYQRAGFVPIGRRAGYYADGADAIRYQKHLAGRAASARAATARQARTPPWPIG